MKGFKIVFIETLTILGNITFHAVDHAISYKQDAIYQHREPNELNKTQIEILVSRDLKTFQITS